MAKKYRFNILTKTKEYIMDGKCMVQITNVENFSLKKKFTNNDRKVY